MRFLSFAAALAALAVPFAAAITSEGAVAAPVAEAPACGMLCIAQNVIPSSCGVQDHACVCTNAPLNAQIELCVKESCSIKDALLTKRFSEHMCQELGVVAEGQDRTALVWIVAVVFGALGMTAFCLRVLARLHVGAQSWGLDDWFMCLAVALMIPLQIISIPLSQHGLGIDMWWVEFESVNAILYYYYWDEMLYITCLAVTKISILCFYLKVFPKRSFRYAAYVLIALNCLYFLSYDFILVFQCQPIDGAWLGWDGEYEAQCISINVLGWSAAAFNIALDVGVIILPLPQLFGLSMSLKKKLQIIVMFAVGFFVTIVSAIRLQSLIHFGTTQNVTQDYVEVGYWSTIEAPVGVICACMPAIRSLFSLVFPQMFGTTQRDKSTYAMGSMGPTSKLSMMQRPKDRSHTTTTTTQINVKQEWTVASSPVDRNDSDEELVRFDEQMASADEHGPRKMTLTRSSSSPWQDSDLEAGRRPQTRGHAQAVSRFDD